MRGGRYLASPKPLLQEALHFGLSWHCVHAPCGPLPAWGRGPGRCQGLLVESPSLAWSVSYLLWGDSLWASPLLQEALQWLSFWRPWKGVKLLPYKDLGLHRFRPAPQLEAQSLGGVPSLWQGPAPSSS